MLIHTGYMDNQQIWLSSLGGCGIKIWMSDLFLYFRIPEEEIAIRK